MAGGIVSQYTAVYCDQEGGSLRHDIVSRGRATTRPCRARSRPTTLPG